LNLGRLDDECRIAYLLYHFFFYFYFSDIPMFLGHGMIFVMGFMVSHPADDTATIPEH